MGIGDFFGFILGKKQPSPNLDPNADTKKVISFVPPQIEDSGYVEAGGYYGSYLDLDGALKTELEFIQKYREMSLHPEVESAIEDICNEAIVSDDQRKSVELILDSASLSESIKQKVRDEYDTILRLLDFNNRGYEIFRRWLIDGKGYYHIIIDKQNPKKGIIELRQIDSTKIKKMVEVENETDPTTKIKYIKSVKEYYTFRDKPTDQNGLKIPPDAICYYHSGLFDPLSGRAISYLHKAIKPLNQLRMIEDAVVIYRIARAPERRIFYIDVGSLPKNKAEAYVRDLMNRYRNKLTYDATTGEMRDDKRFMSMLEDYWLPRREGGKGTEITTLDGGQNLGEMEDVSYFLKKLYKALSVPMSRMETENGFNMGRSSEITRDELKFQKYVNRLRDKFNQMFVNFLRVQCILKGVFKEEEWYKLVQDIRFEYVTDSYFTELKNFEILKERLDILSSIEGHIGDYYSREWVRKNILQQTEKDMKRQDKTIQREREMGVIKDSTGDF